MYDRKTWVVLALCGTLLAAHFHYASINQQAQAEQAKRDRDLERQKAAESVIPGAPRETKAGLTVEQPPPPTQEETIVLENPRVAYTLTNIGGGVKYADFKQEFEVGSPSERVRVNRYGSAAIGTLASAGETLENQPFTIKADESVPGSKVVYIAKLNSGLIAKKTFSLNSGGQPGAPYLLDYTLELENTTPAPQNLAQWSIFLGEASPLYQAEVIQQTGFFWRESNSIHFTDASSFKGGMFSSEKSIQTSPEGLTLDFAGVTNQFFATALRPREPFVSQMWAKPALVTLPGQSTPRAAVSAGLRLPTATLQPREVRSFRFHLFVGPKHNPLLRQMESHWGDGWGDLMQYGWFWFVSRPLNFLLNTYHGWLDGISKHWSWGLSIILLTITVRLLIWPLHAKSTRTMKRMAKLKPEMDRLREKYPDDPNKLNTETMGLYRKYGINPLGGCLPMLIQIPIFFGFYRMLQYAVELRGQGFLWVADLSQPDTVWHAMGIPINLLPIVMAITSFLQIRMTPMTGDKMQQRIILFMPFMFFFFCYSFASALALYWTTQNLFSIGQTWLMNKVPEPELKPVKGGGKSWVQRMAEKQAELQKARQQGLDPNMRNVTPDKKNRPPRTGG